MAKKATSFISAELDWAEEQLAHWKAYVDNNPMHKLVDRVQYKEMKSGMVPVVVSTIESQGKFIQETMKNYLTLLEVVEKLREKDVVKKEARGSGTVPRRMQ